MSGSSLSRWMGLPLAAALGAAVVLGACGGGAACDPSTCDGCCQGDTCQPGSEANACGQGGGMCDDCSSRGQRCAAGQCVPAGGGGGGNPSCQPQGQSCGNPVNCCAGLVCRSGLCAAASGTCSSNAQCDPKSEVCDLAKQACVCKAGFSPCATGCADLANDPLNCGGCGQACSLPNAVAGCVAQRCTVANCAPGFFDADGNPANGCEASCQGLSLVSNGSLSFDLKPITLSGLVTLNGGSAPTGTPRGTLSFLLAGTKKAVPVNLPTTGAATYSVKLFAGTYTITYDKAADCRAAAMPCGTQILQQSITLSSSGSLNLNVVSSPTPTITVSGAVTVNGQPMAASPLGQLRGQILFQPAGATGGVSQPLGTTGPATYSVTLSPGSYDVIIDGTVPCSTQGPLPCQRSVRIRALSLTTNGALNVDLPVVSLSGTVTVNGVAMAASSTGQSRGSLFIPDGDGNGPSVDLGTTGPATYRALVYTGTRSISVSNTLNCAAGPLPCQTRQVIAGVQVGTNGVLDLDLKVVKISGQVTVNGLAMGASPNGASRGLLLFSEGAAQSSVDLGSSGAALYQVFLYAGSYDLGLQNTLDCPTGPIPCGTRTLQAAVPLMANGVYDLSAPVARVSGAVTVNQTAMLASPTGSSRGLLTFKGPTTVTVSIPGTGAASYTAAVYTGSHALSFSNANDCPTGPAPCQTYVVSSALSIAGASSLAVDLPVGDLSGVVTANGAALPASATGGLRGMLSFVEPVLGTVSDDLGFSGAGSYRVRLFPGSYRVVFSNSTDCPATGPGALPCQGDAEVSAALMVPVGPSAASFDLKIWTLSGAVTVNGLAMPSSPTMTSRGVLALGLQPAGAPLQVDLGVGGAATYQARLLQGAYDIGFKNDLDCPNGAVPCQHQVLLGCRVP